jgi:glycosyltransferase involved in cell wall biosynthesis
MAANPASQAPAVRVWVNGRFLSRKVTGVERVAHGLLGALANRFENGEPVITLDSGLRLEFVLAVPAAVAGSLPERVHGMKPVGMGTHNGHLWEQMDLARLPATDWILNLCNTAPLFRHRQAVMLHDAQVFAIAENFSWKFRTWYQLMFKLIGRNSQVLLTNSAFSRDELALHAGLDASKFSVMHLGADHFKRIKPVLDAQLLARLPASPFLLAVSSVNPNKNFSAVLQALDIMGDDAPPCVIVGQKLDHFSGVDLRHDKIIHLGYVPDEVLAALYQRALCLVYPSLYEGFGLPPVEAMVSGCPVIVSKGSSLPEVCGDAALYCDPLDPSTLVSAICRMESPGMAQKMRQAGLERAGRYTWESAAQTCLDALAKAHSGASEKSFQNLEGAKA